MAVTKTVSSDFCSMFVFVKSVFDSRLSDVMSAISVIVAFLYLSVNLLKSGTFYSFCSQNVDY